MLHLIEHFLHGVALVGRVLHVLIIVAVSVLMVGLVEVRVQVEHHELARLFAVYMIISRHLLEGCLALIQLLISLGLRIFVIVAAMIGRFERDHVCGVEFDAAQGRRVLATQQLRLRLVFGARIGELVRRLPKIIVGTVIIVILHLVVE